MTGEASAGVGNAPGIVPLMLAWLAACGVGGVLGALSLGTLSFFGWLFLIGGLVGAAQWVVIHRFLPPTGENPALRWIAGSFGGWAAGQMVTVFMPVDVSTPSVASALVWMLPWALVGLGQCPVLAVAVGRNPRRAWSLMAMWVATSAVGGGVWWGLSDFANTTASYARLEQSVGVLAAGVAQQSVFFLILYGLPTAAALAWITRVAGGKKPMCSD